MRSRWLKLFFVTIALAGVLHVAFVWAVPLAIMKIFMSRISRQAGVNRVVMQPLPTDKSRAVVTPSPDLLYATCIFDVTSGPVRIAMHPPSTYWSLALFDTNTDNFFKLNAADLKGASAEIILGVPVDIEAAKARYPAATYVAPPHASGVMLARILVLDKSNMTEALAAQKSVGCGAATNNG